jgi:hypothetical protein
MLEEVTVRDLEKIVLRMPSQLDEVLLKNWKN